MLAIILLIVAFRLYRSGSREAVAEFLDAAGRRLGLLALALSLVLLPVRACESASAAGERAALSVCETKECKVAATRNATESESMRDSIDTALWALLII